MMTSTCGNCGGGISTSVGPGRERLYRGVSVPLPADFAFSVCQRCAATWMDDDELDRLGEILEAGRAAAGASLMGSAPLPAVASYLAGSAQQWLTGAIAGLQVNGGPPGLTRVSVATLHLDVKATQTRNRSAAPQTQPKAA